MQQIGKLFTHNVLVLRWDKEQHKSTAARTGNFAADSTRIARGIIHLGNSRVGNLIAYGLLG